MKRIITCSDGTWNKPNTSSGGTRIHTNVQKIFDFISKQSLESNSSILQIKHYVEGVGAEGNWFTRYFNGATGTGIDDNIIDAYKFIVWNYEPGDELFLFGFSRGAYTARSLAGLIRKCGIIQGNNLDLIDDAYDLYRNKKIGPDDPVAIDFRSKNSIDITHIKFIGVWDTVGSLGIPLSFFQWWNNMKYSFYDVTLSSIIEHAYHALAIHEKRGNFKPTLWTKSKKKSVHFSQQKLEQRWFSGVHSNVGGGYPNEGLSDIALQWMIVKAAEAGLAFDQNLIKEKVKPDAHGELYNSCKGIYRLLPKYVRHPMKEKGHNQMIDPSVWHRYKSSGETPSPNLKGLMP